MRFLILFLLAVSIVALALIIAGQLGLLRGKAPQDLGFKDGKLKRISRTPNCVSSQAALWPDDRQKDYSTIAPFKISGDGSVEMKKIADALSAMPRTVIVSQSNDYIYAQSTTRMLKFTDDIEFALDSAAGLIHVRSASRLGQKDFGVNRARVEQVRVALGA